MPSQCFTKPYLARRCLPGHAGPSILKAASCARRPVDWDPLLTKTGENPYPFKERNCHETFPILDPPCYSHSFGIPQWSLCRSLLSR